MQGFKSFAEPVSIEFNDGITCIVGPNGSGKSNISDAIRWVLGEQSPKALRGGKMDEVIFAGTANRKSRGMAEVTLTVDNTDGMLPIDYSEVAITRRMYRSGESEYLINGNHCRLKDIRELIMDTGIGVDGYSLIGQGKIADIVANKTESRREIFEEAAGIVMYRTKKAESERKLAAANQNLERVNDVVAEIEGRIDGLKADSIKAKEYVELRDKYKELEINISLQKIDNLDLSNEYMKDEINELTADIEDLAEDKAEIDNAVAANRQRSEELENLYSDANKKLLAAIDEINMLSNRSQVNNEKLSAIDRDTERLTREITEAEEKLAREEKNEAEFAKTKAGIDAKLAELDAVLNEKIQARSRLAEENAARIADIDAMKSEIFSIQNRNTEKRGEKASLEALKANLDRRK
jgi:chromosome segregation protein